MYCRNCGKQIPEDAVFCGHCGERQQPEQTRAHQGSVPQGSDLYGAPGVPMAWFKFIIYFQLFASAALNALTAIPLLSGSIYEGYAEYVYTVFDGLKALDIAVAVSCLLLAGFAIFVRQRLAAFRTDSVKLYFVHLIVNIAVMALYILAASAITGLPLGDLIDASFVGNVAGSLIMLACNVTYFKKRSHLFVN